LTRQIIDHFSPSNFIWTNPGDLKNESGNLTFSKGEAP